MISFVDDRYSWADSGCSAEQGLAALGRLLQEESHIDVIIGPGCSSVRFVNVCSP